MESLHNHTLKSDGKQTHLEALKSAEELGYKIIAFTDHDQVPDGETLKQLKSYAGPVRWLTGIEITTGLHREAEEKGTLHLLGLFVDPTNTPLLQYCESLRQSRLVRMQHYVKHLTSVGFTLTEADCLAAANGSLMGSPHIVEAVERNPENKAVTEQLLKRMEAAGKHDEELAIRYNRMIEEGTRQYPYELYMRKSSFIPVPDGNYSQDLLDFDASVRLIREAGGVTVLAHWFLDKKKMPKEMLEKLVKEGRLDGLEVESKNYILTRDISRDAAYLRELAEQNDLIATVGSDAHDHFDLEAFAKDPIAEHSIGQTQKIIEKIQPSLEWTNFANEAI